MPGLAGAYTTSDSLGALVCRSNPAWPYMPRCIGYAAAKQFLVSPAVIAGVLTPGFPPWEYWLAPWRTSVLTAKAVR